MTLWLSAIERFEMTGYNAFMAIEGKRLREEKAVSEKEKGLLSVVMLLVLLILVFFFLPLFEVAVGQKTGVGGCDPEGYCHLICYSVYGYRCLAIGPTHGYVYGAIAAGLVVLLLAFLRFIGAIKRRMLSYIPIVLLSLLFLSLTGCSIAFDRLDLVDIYVC